MATVFIQPSEPDLEGVQPPMVYIRKGLTWEYKRITRDLDKEQILDEEELNALGAEGWELVTSVTVGSITNFYFRRSTR